MEPAFWRARWAEHKIGFHEGRPNSFLQQHVARLDGRQRILVPLCGKAEDLAFLAANGHEVVGVELVEQAIVEFFAEHAITPEVTRNEGWAVYRFQNLTLIAADWFAMTREVVGPIDGVYDRAAMIAMPGELRTRYVAQLKALVPEGTWGLLVAIDYPADQFEGPPFPLGDAEVRSTFPTAELLGEAHPTGGRIADVPTAIERCYYAQIG
ncbi:MAG TPA: hypothetical protein VGC41_27815 [Kofleriaceae bacterium]